MTYQQLTADVTTIQTGTADAAIPGFGLLSFYSSAEIMMTADAVAALVCSVMATTTTAVPGFGF